MIKGIINEKDFLKEIVKEYDGKFDNCRLKYVETTKPNVSELGISVIADRTDSHIGVMVYADDLTEAYKEYGVSGIEKLLYNAAHTAKNETFPSAKQLKGEMKLENVVRVVINKSRNMYLLRDLPHRSLDNTDLCIVYRLVFHNDENGTSSALVTNELADDLGFTEEMLYRASEHNKVLGEYNFEPMYKIMARSFVRDADPFLLRTLIPEYSLAMPPKEVLAYIEEYFNQGDSMYVITNETSLYGAAAISDYSVLEDAANQLKDDLIILPSSIHEIIVIPYKTGKEIGTEALQEMVHEVNTESVEEKDFLSDSVYLYKKGSFTLTQW